MAVAGDVRDLARNLAATDALAFAGGRGSGTALDTAGGGRERQC